MQIYLLRHGIAEDGRPGKSDADRALTSEGIKRLREILKRARVAGVAPTLIVTSPYVRARQTAEIAAEVLGYEEELVPSTKLVPMASPVETWGEVRELKGEAAMETTERARAAPAARTGQLSRWRASRIGKG